MGRPKEFDSDIVLAAATDCFWANGIISTSISALVEAMKIQRSSFYNSFSSREGILATILEKYMQASPLNHLIDLEKQEDGDRPDLLLIDLILDFSHFLVEDGKGRGCLFFNGLSELKAGDGPVHEIFDDYYAQVTGGIARLLERVDFESELPNSHGTINVQHVLCVLIGMAHYSKLDPTENRLAKIGLDQLSGLSPHFASLIKQQPRTMEAMRVAEEYEQRQAS